MRWVYGGCHLKTQSSWFQISWHFHYCLLPEWTLQPKDCIIYVCAMDTSMEKAMSRTPNGKAQGASQIEVIPETPAILDVPVPGCRQTEIRNTQGEEGPSRRTEMKWNSVLFRGLIYIFFTDNTEKGRDAQIFLQWDLASFSLYWRLRQDNWGAKSRRTLRTSGGKSLPRALQTGLPGNGHILPGKSSYRQSRNRPDALVWVATAQTDAQRHQWPKNAITLAMKRLLWKPNPEVHPSFLPSSLPLIHAFIRFTSPPSISLLQALGVHHERNRWRSLSSAGLSFFLPKVIFFPLSTTRAEASHKNGIILIFKGMH